MRILDEVKLDFSDVLIKPKRSTLISRKEAILTRKFKFRHSKNTWEGIPIMASNMDHTGTIAMNHALSELKMLTALCKFKHLRPTSPVGILTDKNSSMSGCDTSM